jgi:hypothetical protein
MKHTTITSATDAATRAARDQRTMIFVVGTEGAYELAHHTCATRADAFMIVDACGRACEGPKAQELPINAP